MSAWTLLDWFADLDPGNPGGDPPEEPPAPPPPEIGPTPGDPDPPEPPDPGPPPEDGDPEPIKVTIEQWVTEHDGKVCPICGPLDGTTWDAGDGPYPPAHINCRCRRVPIGYELRGGGPRQPEYKPSPWGREYW